MKKIFIFIVFFLISVFALFPEEPLWMKLNQGKSLIDSGELGKAVLLFRKILEKNPDNPEAQKWLGVIFEKENEYPLAQKQLEKALENKKNMRIVEDEIFILYHLANIYDKENLETESMEVLNKIILKVDDEKIPDSTINAMVNILKTRGINKLFDLYRTNAKVTQNAHYFLGNDYYALKNYDRALKHYIFSIGEPVTTIITVISGMDPDYTFKARENESSMEVLLEKANSNKKLIDYMEKVYFFDSMLNAGISLKRVGAIKSGRELLKLVLNFSSIPSVRNKAREYYLEN